MRRFYLTAALVLSVVLIAAPAQAATTVSANGLQKNLNQSRAASGVPALRRNVRLDQAAAIRAKALIRQARLSHGYRATATSVAIRQVGYRARTSGELLAADYFSSAATVTAWRNTPLHRSVIQTRSFRDMGIAVVHTPPGSPFQVVTVVILATSSGL